MRNGPRIRVIFVNGNRFILLSKRPIVWAGLLSLMSHTLMLMVRLPEEKSPKKSEPPEIVQIMELPPTIDRPTPIRSTVTPKPKPSPTPIPSPQSSPIESQPSTEPTIQPISESVVRDKKPPIVPTIPPSNTPTPTITPTIPVPLSSGQIQSAWQSSTNQTIQQYGDRASYPPSAFISVSPETYLEFPKLFYDEKGQPLLGFDGKLIQIEKETPKQVFQKYETNLKNSGFTLSSLPDYGGGLLYEIKQESTVYYLNLLKTPGKDITTIVVIWTTRPSTVQK